MNSIRWWTSYRLWNTHFHDEIYGAHFKKWWSDRLKPPSLIENVVSSQNSYFGKTWRCRVEPSYQPRIELFVVCCQDYIPYFKKCYFSTIDTGFSDVRRLCVFLAFQRLYILNIFHIVSGTGQFKDLVNHLIFHQSTQYLASSMLSEHRARWCLQSGMINSFTSAMFRLQWWELLACICFTICGNINILCSATVCGQPRIARAFTMFC